MYNILLKYNFIKIIPFKDTFFYTSSIAKNIKFSQDLLKLNYSKYSPFKDSSILSSFNNQQLMLWFYKRSVKAPIVIPQSYILFNELKKQNKDAIYIIDDDILKILVIKNGKLLSSFTQEHSDENILNLSTDEYQISNKINISKDEYSKLYKNALKNLTLRELYQWNQLDLDTKFILKNFIDKASYPISALIIFAILVNYTHNSNLQKDIKNLKDIYLVKKNKNEDLRVNIKQHNKEVIKWKEFIGRELIYPDSITILNSIYSIFKKDEGVTISYITINNGKIDLRLKTDINPVVFLNRLSSVSYFSQVIISNTHKPRRGSKTVSYNLDIKLLKDI